VDWEESGLTIAHVKRYTELPYVLQILQTRRITLLNPSSWDDRNDSHFVKTWREKKGFGSALALCLTEAAQTYHHWKIFTNGASGACLFFNKVKLMKWLEEDDSIIGRSVEYRTLGQIQKNAPKLDDLPFIKRKAYQHELEFRLLYSSQKKSIEPKSFPFPIDIIEGIFLNPWLPAKTGDAVAHTIKRIEGFENLIVDRATIIQNDDWMLAATNSD
jgi:hypothetical protein